MADENDNYNPLTELGRSGLEYYSGYVRTEDLPALSGHRWRKVCKTMQNDTVIGAMLFALDSLIRQVDFTFVAGDDSPQAADYKDFFESALFKDMGRPWKDTLSEISTFLPWGFACNEIIYKRRRGMNPGTYKRADGTVKQLPTSYFDDGRIGWDSWPLRGQDTVEKWDFDEFGNAEAMWQLSPPDWKWIRIPMEKLLHFRTTLKKNNPEGESVLRRAYDAYFFRSNFQRFEGIGVERDLNGLPVMKIPAEILTATAGSDKYAILQAYQKLVTNVRKDEQMGLLLPSDRDAQGHPLYEFTLASTGSTRAVDMDAKIERLDQRILMSVLMQFLLLGHQGVGSLALASSQTEIGMIALGSFLDIICDTINRQAVPRLAELNAFQMDLLPQLHHGDVETQDLTALADYVQKLAGVGALVFPTADGQVEDYLKRQASIPVSEHQEQQAQPQKQDAAQAEPNTGGDDAA